MSATENLRIPNSGGTAAPLLSAPAGACDSHMHVFDPARPRAAGSAGIGAQRASVEDYRLLQQRLGIERAVVVTPRYYGTDNSVILDAIRRLGPERTRGVAVVEPDITDAALQDLYEGGIRGVRYTSWNVAPDHAVFLEAAALAPRLAILGLHLQLHWTVDQILAHEDLFLRLPCTVVIDHMGRLPRGVGMAHPAYAILRRRLDAGRTWIKLSGWYLGSDGPPYADTIAVGASFDRAAPDRMVWGTGWPHAAATDKPDGAAMLDALLDFLPDEAAWHRVLVANPAQLYGFATG